MPTRSIVAHFIRWSYPNATRANPILIPTPATSMSVWVERVQELAETELEGASGNSTVTRNAEFEVAYHPDLLKVDGANAAQYYRDFGTAQQESRGIAGEFGRFVTELFVPLLNMPPFVAATLEDLGTLDVNNDLPFGTYFGVNGASLSPDGRRVQLTCSYGARSINEVP